MNNTMLFDQYSFRARLQPALLTLLPAAIAIFAWTGPGVKWQSALWTLFGTAGGTYFLAVLARNLGKKLEPGLWQSWGGAPTTQFLRHTGSANPVMRERWHKNLSKLLGKPFPTASEESANPMAADDIYSAAVKLQISKTRDTKKYHLLFKENIQYGFCRNLFAMKSTGMVIATLSLIFSISTAIWFIHIGDPKIMPWICSAAISMFLYWWITVVNPAWVRQSANAYAERLFESVETSSATRSKK
jgi:hypothetical protein